MKQHHWLALLGFITLSVVLFISLLIVTAPPAAAPTQPENLDDATMRVAKNLYCPVCPGVPLDVCETQACIQWRALIREKLAAGQRPEQIEKYFLEQYGERVLGAPRAQGFNLIVYLAPLLAVIVGGGLLYFTARRWRQMRAVAPPAMSDEYRARIERELQETE